MDAQQNEEFTDYLRGAVRQAEALKYNPTRFKEMIEARGGYEAVKRILTSGKPSDGFVKLWRLGRLDLTCEAIIVESRWRQFFDDELIARAERVLTESRYPFKRFGKINDENSLASLEVAAKGVVSVEGANFDEVVEDFALNETSGQGISAFFRHVLHAPFVSSRWSWGAVDERKRRVFLRLWRLDIEERAGTRWIRVLRLTSSERLGWKERKRHLDLVRLGYAAFAVVCDKDDPDARVILGFDRGHLLKLGVIAEVDGSLWMEAVEEVVIGAQLSGPTASELSEDLREIEDAEAPETTRKQLVDARLGQGRFRRDLMRRWDNACAVTGCRLAAMLRASHCKPWRDSDHRERLDSNNGLILSANLDALFDAGLIGFDGDGVMLVAAVVLASEREALGIPANLMQKPNTNLKEYLRFHRERVFLGDRTEAALAGC